MGKTHRDNRNYRRKVAGTSKGKAEHRKRVDRRKRKQRESQRNPRHK